MTDPAALITRIDEAIARGFHPTDEMRITPLLRDARTALRELQEENIKLNQGCQELADEFCAAIHEPMYAGTRADWKFRALDAEARAERAEALTDELNYYKGLVAANECQIELLTQCWVKERDARHLAILMLVTQLERSRDAAALRCPSPPVGE